MAFREYNYLYENNGMNAIRFMFLYFKASRQKSPGMFESYEEVSYVC